MNEHCANPVAGDTEVASLLRDLMYKEYLLELLLIRLRKEVIKIGSDEGLPVLPVLPITSDTWAPVLDNLNNVVDTLKHLSSNRTVLLDRFASSINRLEELV